MIKRLRTGPLVVIVPTEGKFDLHFRFFRTQAIRQAKLQQPQA